MQEFDLEIYRANANAKLLSFFEYLYIKLGLKEDEVFLKGYFEIVNENDLIESLNYYIVKNHVTAQITANNYISSITIFYEELYEKYGFYQEGLETLTDLGGCALLHLLGEQEPVSACLRQITREIRERQPGCDEVCQKLLEIILLRLLRREDFALSSAPEGPRGSRECDLVRRYIDNHFKENLTLDQLAGMVHMSKYYLSHSFRKEFQTSPISYLISRRIQESRFLLRETDLRLSQIAQILGFSSLSYFSQSFRRLENMSPLEYRRQQRGRPTE